MDYDQKELQAAGDAARERLKMKPKIIKIDSKRFVISELCGKDSFYARLLNVKMRVFKSFYTEDVSDYDQDKIKMGAVFYEHRYRLKEGGSVQTIYQIRFRRF